LIIDISRQGRHHDAVLSARFSAPGEILVSRTVVIDAFPESALTYRHSHAIIVVDIIRAMTSVITAIAKGQRVFPVATVSEAHERAVTLDDPVLAGEQGGTTPAGFDLTNSPFQLDRWADTSRPLILLSSSGTRLLVNAQGAPAVYAVCFRNLSSTLSYVSGRHANIALLEAGSRGERRVEDQIACARLGLQLMLSGYQPADKETAEYIVRHSETDLDEVRRGKSARYLEQSGQLRDLDFILGHIDDLNTVAILQHGELLNVTGNRLIGAGASSMSINHRTSWLDR